MDNELKNLEDELRGLPPRAVPASLRDRLDHDLRPRRRRWPIWVPVPALLALAFGVLLVLRDRSGGAQGTPVFRPVSADSVVVKSTDDGYVTLSDGSVVKRTRRTSVDTVTWSDPAARASLTWSVPREDVTVTPVSYQ